MKHYVQSNTIMPGQYTEINGDLFMAVPRERTDGCSGCQALNRHSLTSCSGYCFRWANGREISFVKAKEPDGDYNCVETSYGRNCRLAGLGKKKMT